MIVLYILLGVLGLIALLLLLPVFVEAGFDGALKVKVRVLFIPFTVYPRPGGKKKRKQPQKPRKQKKAKRAAAAAKKKDSSQLERMLRQEGPAETARLFAELARLAGTAVKRLLAAVTVDRLAVKIVVAGEDAADTAVSYGKICAAVYPAQAVLESVMRIRRRDIAVAPDFLREKGEVSAEVRLHVIPMRVLWAGIRFIAAYIGNTVADKTEKTAPSGTGGRS